MQIRKVALSLLLAGVAAAGAAQAEDHQRHPEKNQ